MKDSINYYEILGVTPFVDAAALKKAYKKAVLKYHPDINHSRRAEEIFKVVLEAYQTLKNPVSRAEYNQKLAEADCACAVPFSLRRSTALWFKHFLYNIEYHFITFRHAPGALDYSIEDILLEMDEEILTKKMRYSDNIHVQKNAARALRLKKTRASLDSLLSALSLRNDELALQVLALLNGLKLKMCLIQLLKSFPHVSIRIRNEIIKLFKNFDGDFINYLLSNHIPRRNPDYKSIAFEVGNWL